MTEKQTKDKESTSCTDTILLTLKEISLTMSAMASDIIVIVKYIIYNRKCVCNNDVESHDH